MPRPKYKQLYREALADYRREQGRRQFLQHRLFEIRNVLARTGHDIARTISDESGPVSFDAHDYLCLESFMTTLARFTREDDEPDNAHTMITWRGRPILRRAETG